MVVETTALSLETSGQGLYELTDRIAEAVAASGLEVGLCHVFCQHTSCSLVLMENADPSARHDLQAWMQRLVPEGDPAFTHTFEGPDDMPAHIKSVLTRSGESLPVAGAALQLGTWQGLFLWEHRSRPHRRSVRLTLMGR